MAITIKGTTAPVAPQATGIERNAAADAYDRLRQQRGKRANRAADLVGSVLDELVENDDDLGVELEAARQMIDEACDELPEGTGMAQAEAIAEKLKQKVEATRGQRAKLVQRVQEALDDLDE